jgi:glycosyltransferase involved in cell wall biosynthesis
MSARPSLLFLSPVLPAADGNGLAMRAGVFLETYARRFDVTLVILPVAQPAGTPAILPAFVTRHARHVEILSVEETIHPLYALISRLADPAERRAAFARYPRPQLCRYAPQAVAEALQLRLDSVDFALVHVERLYMAPLADPYLDRCRCILDLDEDDAETHRAIAALRRRNGEIMAAEADEAEAGKFQALQGQYLSRFDLVLTAAKPEARALGSRHPGAKLDVVPNAVRPPASSGQGDSEPANEVIDLLMVGTLGYYPNADAAQFLCREILPWLSQAGAPPPRLSIVGRAPRAEVQALAAIPGVTVWPDVADVLPFYRNARIAVVPIRAGGGSRIKILEAFAHGVPVVSTGIGAAGLDVGHGEHLLIADSAADFAVAVRRLWEDRALRTRLVAQGRRLLDACHYVKTVAERLESLADPAFGVIDCARQFNRFCKSKPPCNE